MSKKHHLIAFFAMVSAVCAFINNPGDPMKLINTKTGHVVVEFLEGQAIFHDRFLEAEMKDAGILIPPFFKKEFEDKESIFYGDPLFEKAFIKVYYPLHIDSPSYKWEY